MSGDNLLTDEIEHMIENPSSPGDLFAEISDDDSVESMVVSDIPDDTDSDLDFIPGTDSEYYSDDNQESNVELNSTDANGTVTDITGTSLISTNAKDNDLGWEMFEGKQKTFQFTQTTKFNFCLPNNRKPIDFFRHYLTDEVVELMVVETNHNANEVISKLRLSRKSRLKDWKNTNHGEMKQFIGLLLYMGLVGLPRISDYWSKNPLYKFSVARKIMSRNRFQLLLRFWHFNGNENLKRDGRIGKIKPLLLALNNLFFTSKVAEQDLVIDETMVPFRGS
uniref:PiggyBac transposable element-derived protein domain-containing protein n=1 Tax=Homalodisca liturata TaxID=320908 RepID=A0A1B6H727_9HEMI